MIVTTSLGKYVIGGIYQHYNNKKYYMIDLVSKLHDSHNIFLISYHECTIDGIYVSIRENIGQPNEVIIHQPFATHETRWIEELSSDVETKETVNRFTFIK